MRLNARDMPIVDSKDMALRGRIGGYSKAAKYNPQELTGAARAGFLRRFIPDDDTLTEQERLRRGQANLKAYMNRLARLSAIKRKNRATNHNS